MTAYTMTVAAFDTLEEAQSCEAEARLVAQGLRDYNIAQTQDAHYTVLRLFLRDSTGVVVGGLLGEIHWGWLHISVLWLAEPLRKGGYGTQLLGAAEAEAVRRGCHSAFLDTFSFQARPFYEQLGYEVFGRLDAYPPGHERYFLRKRLPQQAPDNPTPD
jgi:GNAT superfamily N-acetyltransferase